MPTEAPVITPNTPAGDANTQGSNEQQQSETPASFDTWLEAQPEEVKGLYTSHTAGLKNALKSEREQRQELHKQLKELADKQEKDSDARKQLEDLTAKFETNEQRVSFYENAAEQGVSNFKLAWLAVQNDQLFNRKGEVDFDALKQRYPELFRATKATPRGNAGNGVGGGTPEPTGGMNSFIRKAAGRT